MKRKRIAFLTNSFARGGAERVLARIIPILMESYEIYLILIDGSKIELECPADIISIGGVEKKNRVLYLFDQIAAKRKLEKIVELYKIESVISFLDVPNLLNLVAKTDCEKVVCVRGAPSGNVRDKMKGILCKRMFRKADAVVSVSNMLRYEMIAKWHIEESKVVTIENPCDIVEINTLAGEEMDKAEADFYASHRVVVAMGRLTKEKGYIYLLDSFKKVLSDQKDVGLVIVGGGGERECLENRAKQLRIEKNVMFCGMKKNPFPYLKKAQIFVLSSIVEGFPNAIIEAMSCGLPVIACDCISGPREILYQELDADAIAEKIEMADYGILIPDFTSRNKTDINEKLVFLADAVKMLLDNDELRRHYEEKALERAQCYTFERCINKYKEIIG